MLTLLGAWSIGGQNVMYPAADLRFHLNKAGGQPLQASAL
jgi:hypothetical protein